MGDGVDKRVRSRRGGDTEAQPRPVLSPATRDQLVRLAYRFLWNVDDAEDAVHDALATAQERIGNLRDRDKWWSWVCRIVVQRCQLHGRERQRRKSHARPYEREALHRRGGGEPSESFADKEELQKALAGLPQRQQEVIVLRHLQGMAYDRIAEVLDISPATARVHARAGREKLRSLLLQRDPDRFEGHSMRDGER